MVPALGDHNGLPDDSRDNQPELGWASHPLDDGIANQDPMSSRVGDYHNEGSSNSEGPTRKKRRSRKGLEKRFECTADGCGKHYSRAEHL